MNKSKEKVPISLFVLSSLMLALSIRCSTQEAPGEPQTFGLGLEEVGSRTNIKIPSAELKFVELLTTTAVKGERDSTYVEGRVTVKTGGHLRLDYREQDHSSHGVRIKMDLKARPRSVSSDGIWSLRLDTAYLMTEVGLVLGAEGLEFLRPAGLRITARGLDLSGLTSDNIGLYYYDEDEGEWELVEPIYLNVGIDKGIVDGCWYIEHFSRYAIASR